MKPARGRIFQKDNECQELTLSWGCDIASNMKTTVDIPKPLLEKCRHIVREQRVTFRTLVEEGLEHVLAQRVNRKPFKLKKTPTAGGGFKAGFDEANWSSVRDEIYKGRGS